VAVSDTVMGSGVMTFRIDSPRGSPFIVAPPW
jgi:hypothetical protein